jgi:hypothetical protein
MKLSSEQKAYLKSIDSKKKRKKQKELFKIKNNSSTNSTLTEHILKTLDIDVFHNSDNYQFDRIVVNYIKAKK